LRFLRFSISGQLLVRSYGYVGREFKLRPSSAGSILTFRNRIEPLRFRIDFGAPANINARISQLAESETASLKNAHAAAGAAAGRQSAAKELLSCEIPEGIVGGTPVPDAPASFKARSNF
jgi:hypothetical protein